MSSVCAPVWYMVCMIQCALHMQLLITQEFLPKNSDKKRELNLTRITAQLLLF